MVVAENVAGSRREGRRQVGPAGPVDVRVDRGQVRPAQPPPEPEHRQVLADLHDQDRPARARRAGPRLLHRDGRPGPGISQGRRRAVAGRRARTSATRCWSSATRRSRKAKAEGAVTLIEGDTQRLPLPDDTLRRRDRRLRPPERGRHGQGDRRDGPRRPARRQGGDPRILQAEGADPRPALPDLLQARPAQGRPDDRPELLRRLQLPAGQRPPVPRRPGDARPPRLPRADRPPSSTR